MGKRKPITYVVNQNGCHICNSHHADECGYRMATIKGKYIAIHRAIYMDLHGELPSSVFVRHKCDNPSCINPEHLEAGSHEDNMKDMIIRGRSGKGIKNPRAKLTEEMVREILVSDENQCALGRKYGVTNSMIHLIKKRKAWKHVSL